MENAKHYILLAFLLAGLVSCSAEKRPAAEVAEIHDWNVALEGAIIRDGFSPPVAARIYAYSNLAYFHLLSDSSSGVSHLKGSLTGLPKAKGHADSSLRALNAGFGFYFIGKVLVYSDSLLDDHFGKWKAGMHKRGWKEAELKAAEAETKEFADAMTVWMNADGYPKTRSMPRYTLLTTEGAYRPTPQDYAEALEPHWGTIRPFFLESSSQFKPVGHIPYDLNPKSPFMQQFDDLLKTTRGLTAEQTTIAMHWDDNSVVAIHGGHATSVEKKLTPGGHWMNIARSLAIKNNLDLSQTARMYCQMTLAMMDAFIACWEAKYHFNSIRPITVIMANIDPSWRPLLVTPPFPEYPSGHSMVSSAASIVLADIFGYNTAFTDSAEVAFGYPPREFASFEAAAAEVSVSRYFGGIHFMKALDDAMEAGRKIGHFHIDQWKSN